MLSMLDRAVTTASASGSAGRSIKKAASRLRTVLLCALVSVGTLSLAASNAADAPGTAAASATAGSSAATDVTARAQALFAQGNQFWTQTFNAGGSYSPATLA